MRQKLITEEWDVSPDSSLSCSLSSDEVGQAYENDSSDEPTDNVIKRVGRSISPVPSVQSMQTDYSRDDPLYFIQETEPMKSRVERSVSSVSSIYSMLTEHSNPHDHPNFSSQPLESRGQTGLVRSSLCPQCRMWSGAPKQSNEVTCDLCLGDKVRAVKFCQTCSAFYCEAHIRRHYTAKALQRHKLEDITEDLDCQLEETKHLSVAMETEQSERQSETDPEALHCSSWKQEQKSGRRVAGNTSLGREVFKEGSSTVPVTLKCEEERRREGTETMIRDEEKKKKEEVEQKIRAQVEKMREETERKIQEEEDKKREEAERGLIKEASKKRHGSQADLLRNVISLFSLGRLSLQDPEEKWRVSKRQISEWQGVQIQPQVIVIREESPQQREESERQIREEERKKREELEKRIRTEMERLRLETERKIREEEREKREELERNIRAETERQRLETERMIREILKRQRRRESR